MGTVEPRFITPLDPFADMMKASLGFSCMLELLIKMDAAARDEAH